MPTRKSETGTYNPGHISLPSPLPPFNGGSDCTVFCVTVNIERGDGGQGTDCLLSVESVQGMVLCNVGDGWPKHFGQDCRSQEVHWYIKMMEINHLLVTSGVIDPRSL